MERWIDRTDAEILDLLQKNARISNKELAARIGLAPSSSLERVRRLEADGVLLGAHAEVAAEPLGVTMHAMLMVQLQKHSREVVEALRDHLLALPEVLAVYLVAGRHDYLVHVAVPDSKYLRDFAFDQITVRPEVVHVETSLIFEYKRNHVMPRFSAPRER